MQFTKIALLAVLAALAQAQTGNIAQDVAALPPCALTCLAPAITAAGCGLADYVCQCTTGNAAITASAASCISTGCSTADGLKTQALTDDICKVVAAMPASSASAPATSAAATSAAAPATSAATSAGSAAVSTTKASSAASSSGSFPPTLATSVVSSASTAAAATSAKVSTAAGPALAANAFQLVGAAVVAALVL